MGLNIIRHIRSNFKGSIPYSHVPSSSHAAERESWFHQFPAAVVIDMDYSKSDGNMMTHIHHSLIYINLVRSMMAHGHHC